MTTLLSLVISHIPESYNEYYWYQQMKGDDEKKIYSPFQNFPFETYNTYNTYDYLGHWSAAAKDVRSVHEESYEGLPVELVEGYGLQYSYGDLVYQNLKKIALSQEYLSNMLSSLLKLTEKDSVAQNVAKIAINAARSAEDTILSSTKILINKIISLQREHTESSPSILF